MKNTDTIKYPLPETELEARVGYEFKDRTILEKALTHSSFSNEVKSKGGHAECNERLEFLGDSVLSILVSEYLYARFASSQEGDLTKIRAAVVCEKALAKYSTEIELGKFLRLGHGEEMNNGRERASIIADAFEALLAAIYLDSGKDTDTVRKFLMPLAIAEIDSVIEGVAFEDYKTMLQQVVQQAEGEVLDYVLVGESGPDHDKKFTIEARLNSNVIGHGTGRSKRQAEQMAAKEALVLFGESRK